MSSESLNARERQLLSSTFISESGLRKNDWDKLRRMLTLVGIKFTKSDEEIEALLDTACKSVATRPTIGAGKQQHPSDSSVQPQQPLSLPPTLPQRKGSPPRKEGCSPPSQALSLSLNERPKPPPNARTSLANSASYTATMSAPELSVGGPISAASSLTTYPAPNQQPQVLKSKISFRDTPNRMLLLQEFLAFVGLLKAQHTGQVKASDGDVLEAFMSVGGQEDMGGDVSAELLRKRFKDISLAVDIDRLIAEVDEDGSGKIEYGEFFSLMTNSSMSACVVPADSILLASEDGSLARSKRGPYEVVTPPAALVATDTNRQAAAISAQSETLGASLERNANAVFVSSVPPQNGGQSEAANVESSNGQAAEEPAVLPLLPEKTVEPTQRIREDSRHSIASSSSDRSTKQASEGSPDGPEMLDPFCLFRRLGGDPDDDEKRLVSKSTILTVLPNIGLNPDELRNYTFFVSKSSLDWFTLSTFTDLVAFVDLGYRARDPEPIKEDEKATSVAKGGTAGLSELLAGVKTGTLGAVKVKGKTGATSKETDEGEEAHGTERSALASALATFEGCLDKLPNSLQHSGSPSSHYFTNKGCIWPPALLHCLYLDLGHLKWFTVKFERRRGLRLTSSFANKFLSATKTLVGELLRHRSACAGCFAHVAKAQKGPSVTERLLKDATMRKSNSSPRGGYGSSPRGGFDRSMTDLSHNSSRASPRPPSLTQSANFRTGSRGINEKHQREDMFLCGKIAVPLVALFGSPDKKAPNSPSFSAKSPQSPLPHELLRQYPDVMVDETLVGASGVLGTRNPKLKHISPRYEVVPDCNAIAMRIFHKGRTLDGPHGETPGYSSPRRLPSQPADLHANQPSKGKKLPVPTPPSAAASARFVPHSPKSQKAATPNGSYSATHSFLPPLAKR